MRLFVGLILLLTFTFTSSYSIEMADSSGSKLNTAASFSLDRCVEDSGRCNHPPEVKVNNDQGKDLLIIQSLPGKTVDLNAYGTKDPDGNSLRYEWVIYPETENLSRDITLKSDGSRAYVKLQAAKNGQTIHLVLKVTDNGIPNLTSYKRIDIPF